MPNLPTAPPNAIESYTRLLEQIVSGQPLSDVLSGVAAVLEQQLPGALASILLITEDGKNLRHGAAPSLPYAYNQAVDGIPVGEGIGSCGTSAATGKATIANDIDQHPYWQNYRALAKQYGLRACWSQPVFNSEQQVLGTFAIYHSQPKEPNQEELNILDNMAKVAGAAIEQSHLSRRHKLAQTLARHLPVGLIVTDHQHRIIEANPALCESVGYLRQQLIGETPEIVCPSLDKRNFERLLLHSQRRGGWHGELLCRRRNSESYTAEVRFSQVHNEQDELQYAVLLLSDVSESKRSQETIHYLANYDVLTDLPNRNLFYHYLTECMEKAHKQQDKFALMLLDLDYFKEINDQLGHEAGDELLIKTGSRLMHCLGDKVTLARLGGDEFGIIVHEHWAEVAAAVVKTVNQPCRIRHIHQQRVTASVGLAIFPDHGDTIERLMKAADQAVYAAKDRGRNGFCLFDSHMEEHAQEQASLHQDLHKAHDDHQFELYYQPLINVQTGEVCQLEALLRWNNPRLGLVSPDRFIPLAEKTGMIREIGHWVRDSAMGQYQRLAQLGCALPIAVNLSSAELYDDQLAQRIIGQCQHYGLPANALVVEITESLLIDNKQDTQAFLQQLQQAGIAIAIDDFGTGYSSLSYLAAFPVQKLKIDRSFIQQIQQDTRKQALVSTMIDLGHALGMEVTAEGIETQQELDMLKSQGCDTIQGFLISRPMPAAQLEEFLVARLKPSDK